MFKCGRKYMSLFDTMMGNHFTLKTVEKLTKVRDESLYMNEQKLLQVLHLNKKGNDNLRKIFERNTCLTS